MTDNPPTTQSVLEEPKIKLSKASYAVSGIMDDPWNPVDIDKFDSPKHQEYSKLVKECRFYYRKDAIASTVINKLVEIGMTSLVMDRGKLSQNEVRVFNAIKEDLEEFANECALEYLVTGLVVPEITFETVPASDYKEYGLKKMSTITIPTEMWVRDSGTIKMNSSIDGHDPSYYVIVPDSLVYFITSKGYYPDGTKDILKYNEMLKLYPEFVLQVQSGVTEILLENDLVIRRKPMADSPYPTPYLSAALETLKHKRNLKRLDYSIAARAIGAIQQFSIGNDNFPATEDDGQAFNDLKAQMAFRNSQGTRDIERIFQLFTNHTVEIKWVYPPLDALLDEKKYAPVNEDIFFSLGFPRILTTGETNKTGTSDPEFASLSPVKTMQKMQKAILDILQDIVKQTAEKNGLADFPKLRFMPIALHSFKNFVEGLRNLYDTGNLSRTTYADAFGYNFEEEAQQLKLDKEVMKENNLDEFAPKPYSPSPNQAGGQNGKVQDKTSQETKKVDQPSTGNKTNSQ